MRPSIEEYFTGMLKLVAARSTCPRRAVGAIITDYKGQVLATGYNGVPRGYPHCIDHACPGIADKSGDTKNCYAVHAEANAILQCADLGAADVIYCSTQPCFECCKLLANTPISVIIFLEPYPDHRGIELLVRIGKIVRNLTDETKA